MDPKDSIFTDPFHSVKTNNKDNSASSPGKNQTKGNRTSDLH